MKLLQLNAVLKWIVLVFFYSLIDLSICTNPLAYSCFDLHRPQKRNITIAIKFYRPWSPIDDTIRCHRYNHHACYRQWKGSKWNASHLEGSNREVTTILSSILHPRLINKVLSVGIHQQRTSQYFVNGIIGIKVRNRQYIFSVNFWHFHQPILVIMNKNIILD